MAEVVITIPDHLADEWGRERLSRTILEAVAIEGYRQERLSQGEVGALLGLSFSQTEAFLQERGIPLHYDSEDFEADRDANQKLLSR
jgi:predicted HTH domain antitoxin